ncbi:MAG TPA: RNA polymerase sigma factor [Phycisphaerae bacterium]|nr:RNA polymerase sigma factor [Phycisphaerae bacterium]
MSEPEAQLVQQCLAGEKSAFESLYDEHAGRIKAYLARSGFTPADADDLTQETFVRAFGSLGTFDAARGSMAAWLAAIARNVARRYWNRRGDARDFDPELAEQTLAAEDNPHLTAQASEENDAVTDCVADLTEELARIVHMRYAEARTTRGIARATGMPEATVRLRLSEAIAALERCLKSKGILE